MLKPSLLALCFSALIALPARLSVQDPGQPRSQQNPLQNPAPSPANPASQASNDQAQEAPEEMRANMEEGVKHMLLSQIEAWNHGRLEGFMQGYWHSPDLVFFSGSTVTKGWEPMLERYQQRYQSQGKEMGKLEFQELKIDIVGRKAAVVTGRWQLTMSNAKTSSAKTPNAKTPDGNTPHGLFTLIVKRMPAGWKIVHDHTSGE